MSCTYVWQRAQRAQYKQQLQHIFYLFETRQIHEQFRPQCKIYMAVILITHPVNYVAELCSEKRSRYVG